MRMMLDHKSCRQRKKAANAVPETEVVRAGPVPQTGRWASANANTVIAPATQSLPIKVVNRVSATREIEILQFSKIVLETIFLIAFTLNEF
jgi:hypothetical protein